tara:strand:- start:367 stop:591 length:225 start_codon:yes stop_codon:yes gene_type:complete
MTYTIGLYNSEDKNDEVYWDVDKVATQYDIKINDTDIVDWGGANLYEISGKKENLEKFATEFCLAANLAELVGE